MTDTLTFANPEFLIGTWAWAHLLLLLVPLVALIVRVEWEEHKGWSPTSFHIFEIKWKHGKSHA